MKRYIFTCGDINGIGPEIALKVFDKLRKLKNSQFLFICPENVFHNASKLTNTHLDYSFINDINEADNFKSKFLVYNIGRFKISPGKPTKTSGKASILALEYAMKFIKKGVSNTLITLPISKAAVKKAGFKYPGHTEFLAASSGKKNYLMMFISKKMKCAVSTIHIPLRKVKSYLTKEKLLSQLNLLDSSLRNDFGIIQPRIAVLGLNPHAGEEGKIGSEENEIITPAIKKSTANIFGPFVPDAFFGQKLYENHDCTFGMYHDQVLIPFKMLDFANGVNYTAGLDFIRTSPDHGTAFDIAWRNKADIRSTLSAFKWAELITKNRFSN